MAATKGEQEIPRGKAEQAEVIIPKLREVEVELGRRQTVAEAVKKIGATEQTYYRWKKKHGGLRMAQPIRRLDLVAAGPATAVHDDQGVSPDMPHDNQGALACCRGPSVESGASGGDGTGAGRTDEPISRMVQFRTVSNVGATALSQRITGTPSTSPRWPYSRNTSNSTGRMC